MIQPKNEKKTIYGETKVSEDAQLLKFSKVPQL